jgi:hypothetical protein
MTNLKTENPDEFLSRGRAQLAKFINSLKSQGDDELLFRNQDQIGKYIASDRARIAKLRLQHNYNILQFAIRNALYEKHNLEKTVVDKALVTDIEYLSRRWHNDAEVLQQLKQEKVDTNSRV